jgi:hypothetical protein
MAKGKKTGGRVKGTPNKATATLKEAITHVVDSTRGECLKWLQAVAEGQQESEPILDDEGEPVLDETGKPKLEWSWLRRPEPATALKLWAELAEFLQPKLARTEHTDSEGKPLPVVQVTFVKK